MILLRQKVFGETKRLNKAKKREWLVKEGKKTSSDWLVGNKRVELAAKSGRFMSSDDALANLGREKISGDIYYNRWKNPINYREEYQHFMKNDLHSKNSTDREIARDYYRDSIERKALRNNKEALDIYKEHKKAANKVTKEPKRLKESVVASVKPKKSALRSKTIAKKIRSKTNSPTWAEVVRKALR